MLPTPQLPALLTALMRLLPLQPLELALGRLVLSIAKRHPELFDRLGPHSSKAIGIVPTDVPAVFVLKPDRKSPRLEVRPENTSPDCDALIVGPTFALFDLVEGRLDGDALFFSREIRIEGDVEAVLALRNALDSQAIDLVREATAPLGGVSAGPEVIARRLLDLIRSGLAGETAKEAVQ